MRAPFYPDRPVPPELFAGRKDELAEIKRSLESTSQGRAKNLLVASEPGLGKTSLALFVQHIVTNSDELSRQFSIPTKKGYFVTICNVGCCKTLIHVPITIIESFRKSRKPLSTKVADLAKFLQSLGLGPFSVGVKPSKVVSDQEIYPQLVARLIEILTDAQSLYDAIIVILDETEVISDIEGVAVFLKSVVERLFQGDYNNISFFLNITPEGVRRLASQKEGVLRTFDTVELRPMTREEINELIIKALHSTEPLKNIERDVVENIFFLSDGLPEIVQLMGECVFEADDDNNINMRDFRKAMLGCDKTKGVLGKIKDKYLPEITEEVLLNKCCTKLLYEMAESETVVISFSALRKKMWYAESTEIEKCLKMLESLNIIKKIPCSGEATYQFVKHVAKVWFKIKSTTHFI